MNENYELNLNEEIEEIEEFDPVELTQEEIEMNESYVPAELAAFYEEDEEDEDGLGTAAAMLIGAGITIIGAVAAKKLAPKVTEKFHAWKEKRAAKHDEGEVIEVDFCEEATDTCDQEDKKK